MKDKIKRGSSRQPIRNGSRPWQVEVTGSGGMGSLSGAGVASSEQAAKPETPKKRGRKKEKAE